MGLYQAICLTLRWILHRWCCDLAWPYGAV